MCGYINSVLTRLRNNRNWRWHKVFQIWLTKDDTMTPVTLSQQAERGYYIVWDTNTWSKARVSIRTSFGNLSDTKLTGPL